MLQTQHFLDPAFQYGRVDPTKEGLHSSQLQTQLTGEAFLLLALVKGDQAERTARGAREAGPEISFATSIVGSASVTHHSSPWV